MIYSVGFKECVLLNQKKKDDERKTAFKTEFELFEYTIMLFELKNISTTFQVMISEVLRKYLKNFVITYLSGVGIE